MEEFIKNIELVQIELLGSSGAPTIIDGKTVETMDEDPILKRLEITIDGGKFIVHSGSYTLHYQLLATTPKEKKKRKKLFTNK